MILFIDTHDSLITIGLKTKDKLIVKEKESEYSHSVFVMPMIKEIFDENKLDIKSLEKIIVVNGPGSFTGIRIGLTIAKTLAYALDISINTISSLKAYLLSYDSNEVKQAIIRDNKGCYICVYDKDNNIIIPETYETENIFENKYKEVDYKLNIEKIIRSLEYTKSENYHHIKANYIKKIEVEK